MRYDYAIVGAGIAGASLAAELAPHARVLLLEGEAQPGYHSTGRSAAFWSESYGGPGVAPLTIASGPALQAGGFLAPLGSLHVGHDTDAPLADEMLAKFAGTGIDLSKIDPATRVPGMRPEWTQGVWEPTAAYIDVGGLHGDVLSRAKKAGTVLVNDARLESAHRSGDTWRIETHAGAYEAGVLVNAAGAWADEVAAQAGAAPLGIQPYRRTVVQLRVDPETRDDLPHVAALDGSFYFKPEAGGKLWLSPADETPVDPHDTAPEELDVAIAIDRLEHAVDWRIVAVERRWAGLRSFAADRLPVYGFDDRAAGFFWCAGQGGFGIQTAPAAAALAASLLLPGKVVPPAGVDAAMFAPGRFG